MAGVISRYLKLKSYKHHTYLEGFDFPVLGTGPFEPVASCDNRSLLFSCRGWIWQYDIESQEAVQLTQSQHCDFNPSFSHDGKFICFVRDTTTSINIMLLNRETGLEQTLLSSLFFCLNPQFSFDDLSIYYSSSEAGDMNIWRLTLATGERIQITKDSVLDLYPKPLSDNERIIYLSKTRLGVDKLCVFHLKTQHIEVLRGGSILSQTRLALSHDSKTLAVNWPDDINKQNYQLWLIDVNEPTMWLNLTTNRTLPLTPCFSADKQYLYFVEANEKYVFTLKKMSVYGPDTSIESVTIKQWHTKDPCGTLTIETRDESDGSLIPARLCIKDSFQHPIFSDSCIPKFDSQNGTYYFHSTGTTQVHLGAGHATIEAVRGFNYYPCKQSVTVLPHTNTVITITLKRFFDPRKQGWYSADNHLHLNYGGTYYLKPADMIPILQAEDLDVALPMTANLNTRTMDREWINWKYEKDPYIYVMQEVRSHFLGHVGLINIKQWYWPWFYGPLYPLYTKDDIPNSDPLMFARKQEGTTIYVHPVASSNPFDESNLNATPAALIQDAFHGLIDLMEILCTASNEVGTCEIWYKLLNCGIPIQPTAGSDTFVNYYRNQILGVCRLYVKINGKFSWKKFNDSLKKGATVASSGPMILFSIDGKGPGECIKPKKTEHSYNLTVYSPTPYEKIEIIVNGLVHTTITVEDGTGEQTHAGQIHLPSAGWVAAKVSGSKVLWPVMHGALFGHTAPLWINTKGSKDAATARSAAADLLRVLVKAEENIRKEYSNSPIPRINAEIVRTKEMLKKLIEVPISEASL